MFLKSLSMKGFKSFADPTVLEMEPGMTVVVGPNGSGKSNVVDAVTWVLGAQGPRALRSQRMEDVIFAGTSSRPALGRAEVSLTIDNSSRKLPVDLAEVTITRTLFRSGDSEYAINGTPCRLLDIQDLLSDSGVGRSQHMIVGQGQLDAVLNARPEDRRAVIEEAAGVLKHRRRRERAERRLAATQENLERLGDLVREVRRQIRPLERQAQAARSHAVLAAELRAVRVHLAGAELVELAARRQAASDGLSRITAEEAGIRAAADRLDAEMTATSAELSLRAEDDLASSLGWVQALVERAKGTANVVRERSRATSAALDAVADVDVVSTLDAEASRLSAELTATESEEAAIVPDREALAARERDVAAVVEAYRSRLAGTDEPAAMAALADAFREVEVARHTLEQGRRALRSAGERLAGLDGRLSEMDAAIAVLDRRSTGLEAEAARLAQAATATDADHVAAREAAERAESAARAADQERHRTAARAEALARALHELEGLSGREALDGIDGVVGSLVDLVEIDAGWEAAFEAAAGASVSAVVVSGRDAARAALDRLHSRETAGALLAAYGRQRGGRSSLEGSLPWGAEPLRPHVRARRSAGTSGDDAVEAVLDTVCGGAVKVDGWEAALDLALDRPDLVVVTVHGDRFAPSGWRVRPGRGVVTAAAVEDAERRAGDAAERADTLIAGASAARDLRDRAAAAVIDAARARDRHEAARAAVEAERRRAGQERERVAAELVEGRRDLERMAGDLQADEQKLSELEAAAATAEATAAAARARAATARSEAEEIDGLRRELEAGRQALQVREAGLEERRRVLTERHAEVERRLSGHAEEREAAAARRQRLEADGVALRRLGGSVARELQRLEAALGSLRADYADQIARSRAGATRMEELRQERAALEERQAAMREQVRQLDRDQAEASARQEALSETVEADLGVTVEEAMSVPRPELPEGVGASDHAVHLAAELAALGPVNPLALEELSALEARHHELDTQMEDVRAARRQLHEVARQLDRQIAEQFAAAAADVGEHFSELVSTLFPGGTGRLTLTDPEDLLGTGVEIEVRPAGRNVRRVSLLSGGERSMAALAFLFAVFRSRPSPFYLMDEVEAALDDVNLHRFLSLVRQFRHEAQLIVVSHQKRTMEAADALYGVTMAPGGSSQVVSQRAPRPEAAGTLVSP